MKHNIKCLRERGIKKFGIGVCIVILFSLIIVILSGIIRLLPDEARKKKYDIHPVIKEYLANLTVKNCSINFIGDYKGISTYIEIPKVSDEEIEGYIDSVKNEYGKKELSIKFIKKKLGYQSVDELIKVGYDELLEQKKISALIDARNNVMEEIFRVCEFNLDIDEVVAYSLSVVRGYESEAHFII